MSTDLSTQLERVCVCIAEACERSGRDPGEIEILAVTKTQPLEVLNVALAAGLNDLGENRVQEALPKILALPASARVHLIGRLQSNKVNRAVGTFASIQSVDREDLLHRIARRAEELGVVQKIWIQVGISREDQKGGCDPELCSELWEQALAQGSTDPRGLMGMARVDDDEASARKRFTQLRELAVGLRQRDGSSARLSMGMSRDFEWAVEEGSHQLRLGSVLFGPRRPI